MTAVRGTSNGNANGNSVARAARRVWLVQTYRADVDVKISLGGSVFRVPRGEGIAACRCYRCGRLLLDVTGCQEHYVEADPGAVERLREHHVTVDRIAPGCQGGTYRRTNIRPACSTCNSETGGGTRAAQAKPKRSTVQRPSAR